MSQVSDLCERLFSVPDLRMLTVQFASAMVLRAARKLASEGKDPSKTTEADAREMLAHVVANERAEISRNVTQFLKCAIDLRDSLLGCQLAVNIMADGNVMMVLDEAQRIKATPIN